MRNLVLVVAVLTLTGSAFGVPPENDDVALATSFFSVPLTATVDTSDATSTVGDLDCSGLEDTHTVWFMITPTADGMLGLRTRPEFPSEVFTAVATGSPGALTLVQCSSAATQTLDATGGTTYYIQLATAGAEPGGVIEFQVEGVEPVAVSLDLARNTRRLGDVLTVQGTLRCSRPLPPGSEVVVQGSLKQGSASGWLVPFHSAVGCPTTPMKWETTVQPLSGALNPGWADLTGIALACDDFTCAPNDAPDPARVRLR